MKYFLTFILLLITCTVANSNNNDIRTFIATGYCHGSAKCKIRGRGITALGTKVREGIIAVDKRVIPLGSKVRIIHPEKYAGIYIAEDTGSRKYMSGNRIDIWRNGQKAAMSIGKRIVKLQIIKDLAE